MLLEEAANWLGWPESESILTPTGAGANVYAQLIKQKIGGALKRKYPSLVVETGLLTPDPSGADTSAPLAIVCQFPSGASDEALREAHRLAWNFSRAALLVTLEPHRLLAWSCLREPGLDDDAIRICELLDNKTAKKRQDEIRELLHWVSLITGNLQKRLPRYFPSDGRADALLLKNLKYVRKALLENEPTLEQGYCHDLLARIVFTQFLFDRKDSDGKPFFSEALLARLRDEGVLKEKYAELAPILADKDETYALFRWMDERFNGDLFPGKAGQSDAEREAAWQAERSVVNPHHLQRIAELVSGNLDVRDRQLTLWRYYAFDIIPLEFISSIYEEFLKDNRDISKAYYTPPQLVDYVLDAVLPWEGDDWDLRILDPACGSGIFLVKAFQRLIHRWRGQHDRDPQVSDLKPLLANNFFGVDINPDAVRVACFSLYLAMIDAIDPKHYVTREKVFPRLRGTNLLQADFFDETIPGIRTDTNAGSFDLVVGNAPWGRKSIESTSSKGTGIFVRERGKPREITKAELWARNNQWPVANKDIGTLFVSKGLSLTKESGRCAMIQSATSWLYQRGEPAQDLREKLFASFTVDEITNLSALRRELFTDVIGPACVLVAGRYTPKPGDTLLYLTPKPRRSADGTPDFRIEPQDVNRISHEEAANDPLVWSVLALGGRRDLYLIRRLLQYPTLAKLKAEGKVQTRRGVGPGTKKELPQIKDKSYFDGDRFPNDHSLELNADVFPAWGNRCVTENDSTNFEAFKNPQLLIKYSYVSELDRFQAALVRSNDPEWGVICKKTHLSVRDNAPDSEHIRRALPIYNSFLTTYFLFMTGSQGLYTTAVPTNELLHVPLAGPVTDFSRFDEHINAFVRDAFSLTEADSTIIEDFLDITLPGVVHKTPGPGRQATNRRIKESQEPELSSFAETAIRVLKATFGGDKPVSATIYREPPGTNPLPARMLTMHLMRIPTNVTADSAHRDRSPALSATGV
uniref:site-specific DNA-methyltransferase (adenine-specific) n=1 Tax=Candidatus Kentrum sp. SD TaxID=2126332 RepID=A0A451BL13_9GAMM|nr:MAG: N-6 DNA Methylase [Candidatus Kentron sp. SD]